MLEILVNGFIAFSLEGRDVSSSEPFVPCTRACRRDAHNALGSEGCWLRFRLPFKRVAEHKAETSSCGTFHKES